MVSSYATRSPQRVQWSSRHTYLHAIHSQSDGFPSHCSADLFRHSSHPHGRQLRLSAYVQGSTPALCLIAGRTGHRSPRLEYKSKQAMEGLKCTSCLPKLRANPQDSALNVSCKTSNVLNSRPGMFVLIHVPAGSILRSRPTVSCTATVAPTLAVRVSGRVETYRF